jgi:hypothetical protein
MRVHGGILEWLRFLKCDGKTGDGDTPRHRPVVLCGHPMAQLRYLDEVRPFQRLSDAQDTGAGEGQSI